MGLKNSIMPNETKLSDYLFPEDPAVLLLILALLHVLLVHTLCILYNLTFDTSYTNKTSY